MVRYSDQTQLFLLKTLEASSTERVIMLTTSLGLSSITPLKTSLKVARSLPMTAARLSLSTLVGLKPQLTWAKGSVETTEKLNWNTN